MTKLKKYEIRKICPNIYNININPLKSLIQRQNLQKKHLMQKVMESLNIFCKWEKIYVNRKNLSNDSNYGQNKI